MCYRLRHRRRRAVRLLTFVLPALAMLLSGSPLWAQTSVSVQVSSAGDVPDSSLFARVRAASTASSSAGLTTGLTMSAPLAESAATAADAEAPVAGQLLHAAAIEHSAAYETRAKIHRYASLATLPLFGTELMLGQSLYNGNGGGSKRGAHAAVGATIAGLFAVNTVTGAWNMFGEGRSDPNNKKLRLLHGLLMMAADAGFMATAASAPDGEGERGSGDASSGRATHRSIAIASISMGTVGYLAMLFGNR